MPDIHYRASAGIFTLTVEWDRDPKLDWDRHWRVFVSGPGVRHLLAAYPAYTDARRHLGKVLALIEEMVAA